MKQSQTRLRGMARSINYLDIKGHSFSPNDWYEYGETFDHPIEDLMFIKIDKPWPKNFLTMSKFSFETYFVTKEKDRDIKIEKILNE